MLNRDTYNEDRCFETLIPAWIVSANALTTAEWVEAFVNYLPEKMATGEDWLDSNTGVFEIVDWLEEYHFFGGIKVDDIELDLLAVQETPEHALKLYVLIKK